MNERRILVVGCGAIGGIFAVHLARVAEVVGLDANTAHVEAIARDSLQLTGVSSLRARFPVVATASGLAGERFDAVIVLVKSQATEAAIRSVVPHLAGTPLVVTMQNGMGNVEALATLVPWPIAHGVTMEAGRYDGPGKVHHLIRGEASWLGPARGTADDVRWLADLFTASGLPTRFADDPRGAIWSKFIFNCVQNPVGAIVLGVNAARFQVPEVRAVIDAMFAEGIAVAEAQGIRLAFDPMSYVKKVRSGELPMSRHAGSMAADIEAGRETELESLLGYLVRKGQALGVPVPTCETVYRLAKGVEFAARIRRQDA